MNHPRAIPSRFRLSRAARLGLLAVVFWAAWVGAQAPAAPTNVQVNAALQSQEQTRCTDAANGGTARYLDAAAVGSDNGTSYTNAWRTLAQAEAGATRGQTVCVTDGTYSGAVTFNTANSGTTYITFVKATVADHGTETGWADTKGDGEATFTGVWTFDTSYWDMDGAIGGGPGDSVDDWPTSWQTGHGFNLSTGANTYNVLLCDTDDNKSQDGLRFRHIKFTNGTSLTYTGTQSAGIFRVETTGCSWDDIIVEYAYVPPAMNVPFHVWGSNNWTIQYSYFDENGNGNDGNFHREFWSAINNDNWVIRWNYFKGINNTGVIGYVNEGDAATGIEIYGNLFTWGSGDQVPGFFLESDVNLTNWRVFNNTVVGWNDSWGCPGLNAVGGLTGSIGRNNIVAHHDVNFGGCTFDWGTESHDGFYSIIHQGTTDVTANYAAASTNAQTFGSSPFTNYPTDLSLVGATTAGSSSDSPAGNSVDMFGCTRGGDGTWDRGALEFGC